MNPHRHSEPLSDHVGEAQVVEVAMSDEQAADVIDGPLDHFQAPFDQPPGAWICSVDKDETAVGFNDIAIRPAVHYRMHTLADPKVDHDISARKPHRTTTSGLPGKQREPFTMYSAAGARSTQSRALPDASR
jgi:hypothetical protein